MGNAALTVLLGVIVYALSQLLSKFFIDPIQELRKTIGEVRFSLAYFAPIIQTPISRTKELSDEAYAAVMKSSCDLLAKLEAIPFYRFIPKSVLPPATDIERAAKALRGLSTYLHETGAKAAGHVEEVNSRVSRIEECLRLKPLE